MSVSGSSMQRVLACPASETLPHTRAAESPEAARGTAIHTYLQMVPELGQEAALDLVEDEHRAACESIELDKIPEVDRDRFAAEVAFAYDWETGAARTLPTKGHRDYSAATDREIPMTLDVIGVNLRDRVALVMDYKTGWGDVPRAWRNAQLLMGALAATRVYGLDTAEVAIIRIRPDGDPYYDRATISELALAEFEAKVQNTMRSLSAGDHDQVPNLGPHCRYCPAFSSCPGQVGLARAITSSESSPVSIVGGELTPESAAEAWQKLKLARRLLASLSEHLTEYAIATGGFDLPNGKRLAVVEKPTNKIDGGIALTVARREFTAETLEGVFQIATTKGKLDEIIGDRARRNGDPIGKARADFWTKLDEAGAITTTYKTSVAEVNQPRGDAR